MKYNKSKLILIFLLFFIFLIGCSGEKKESLHPNDLSSSPKSGQDSESVNLPEKPQYPTAEQLATWKVNEAGKVMILMYHIIGTPQESDWAQTTANFRRDLAMLDAEGYSLISLKQFLDNDINVPAGRTPVILTFDDGSIGHCRYLVEKDGTKRIDPECAAGILLDFGKGHPLFGHTATFYVNNDPPFGQKEFWQDKIQEMVSLDFDIGNHTSTHPKLNKLSTDQVQKELAGLARLIEETVPGYKVDSLALPYGISPLDKKLAEEGTFEGYTYKHRAVLKVGANPALSPVVKGFDALKLPRVQASTPELTKWLEYFKKNPDQRYISDGNPQTVAIPWDKEELLEQSKVRDKKVLIWGNKEQ